MCGGGGGGRRGDEEEGADMKKAGKIANHLCQETVICKCFDSVRPGGGRGHSVKTKLRRGKSQPDQVNTRQCL